MSMTINGIPTNITRAKLVALVESLGIDVRDLKRMEIGSNMINVTLGARGPDDKPYLNDFEVNQVAVHRISIPVID